MSGEPQGVIAEIESDLERRRFAKSPAAVTLFGALPQTLSIGLLLCLILIAAPNAACSPPGKLRITTASTRPDMVSGGGALVEIDVPADLSPHKIKVVLDGRDITKEFRRGSKAGTLLGLVTGLSLGENTLTAEAIGEEHKAQGATLRVINHPIVGPIFSGPHQTPFICETQAFILPDKTLLGAPLDTDCSIETRINYLYKSSDGTFKPLARPSAHPADTVQTTTSDGHRVNYIVRVETGTINRAIYQIWILQDPAADPALDPFTRPAGWNGKLIFSSGGGLNPGYRQGVISQTGVLGNTADLGPANGAWLSLGYAYAQSTLNVNQSNNNTVLTAETAMMIKEHFIDEFGPVRFTIGTGISGGSMQTNEIAQAYPGIFDGIVASGFADNITTVHNLSDCALLDRAFKAAKVGFSREQMTAISGWGDWQGCEEWINLSAVIGRAQGLAGGPAIPVSSGVLYAADTRGKTLCNAILPLELMYDPAKNPRGARCTYQDNSVNIFGRDPKTGFARRPFDNVGVQYGLVAFNAGRITPEQFVEFNELVGGYDLDGNIVNARYAADPEALRMAYVSGRFNNGAGAASIPVIDEAWPSAPMDFRNGRVSTFSIKARMISTNGHADNEVIVTSPPLKGASGPLASGAVLIQQMDHWLENIASDPEPTSREKFVRTKPADLTDGCYKPDGTKIEEPADYKDPNSPCNKLYPVYGTPRIAAGAPITDDVLKCQLKPLNPKDYVQPLTAEQIRRLNAVFPQGVCDFSRPGVGQQPAQFWLSYPLRQ
jgi:hypothetical protein